MDQLKEKLETELRKIKSQFNAMQWNDPAVYAEFLAQTFYYAQHTTRILALAGVRTPFENRHLHGRFLAHCGEEKGHDRMLLNDLKFLKREIGQFRASPATSALYQSQYYLIEHVSPMALFGFILLLEAVSLRCGPDLYSAVSVKHKNAATYLKVHIEEDQDHVEQNLKNIATLGSTELAWIEENLINTSHYYVGMLQEVQAAAKGKVHILKAA